MELEAQLVKNYGNSLRGLRLLLIYVVHLLGVSISIILGLTIQWAVGSRKAPETFLSTEYWSEQLPFIILLIACYALVQYGRIQRKRNKLLAAFGARAFSPHDTQKQKAADWSQIASDIDAASEQKSPLYIMSATGKAIFQDPLSPLYRSINNYRGEVHVLLLRPNSDGVERRVAQLHNLKPEYYQNEILDSIEVCQNWRKGRPANWIQIRLYNTFPIWKMIMTPNALWLQHFSQGIRGDDSPLYGFRSFIGQATIYDGFQSVFDKRWGFDETKIVDLDQFNRSSWKDSC
jgi:hypothetical protein